MTKSSRHVALGGGTRVPYPEPTSAAATKIGKANRRVGTRCEVLLRSRLHASGLRFRKDHLVVVNGLRVKPDIVFTRAKVAVFVDGCFWHACPDHFHAPKSNLAYWEPKIASNVARDKRVTSGLEKSGWLVIRVWEHEDVDVAASSIQVVVTGKSVHKASGRAAMRT